MRHQSLDDPLEIVLKMRGGFHQVGEVFEERLDVGKRNGGNEVVDVVEGRRFHDALYQRHVVEFESEDEGLLVVFIYLERGFYGGRCYVQLKLERVKG